MDFVDFIEIIFFYFVIESIILVNRILLKIYFWDVR